jgi:hypothetical protein
MVTYYITASETYVSSVETLETDREISENDLLKFCRKCVENYYNQNDQYPRYLVVSKSDLDLVIKIHKCYWLNFSETSFWLETVSQERINSILHNPDSMKNFLVRLVTNLDKCVNASF